MAVRVARWRNPRFRFASRYSRPVSTRALTRTAAPVVAVRSANNVKSFRFRAKKRKFFESRKKVDARLRFYPHATLIGNAVSRSQYMPWGSFLSVRYSFEQRAVSDGRFRRGMRAASTVPSREKIIYFLAANLFFVSANAIYPARQKTEDGAWAVWDNRMPSRA